MGNYIYSKEDLAGILKNLIQSGQRWEHYKHTVDVADYWKKIISGKGHQDIILSLRTEETKDQQKQRIRLYNPLTKCASNKILAQIKEVYRSDNIFYDIYFRDKQDQDVDRIKKLNVHLNNFSGKKSVRDWLRSRFLRLNAIDPNAYIIVNFNTDPIAFFPLEVRSKDVLKPYYQNGILQYLAFVECKWVKVVKDGKITSAKAYKYWCFSADYAVLYYQVPVGADPIGEPVEIKVDPGTTLESSSIFQGDTQYSWYYSSYEIKAGDVSAFCVGFVPDAETDDQTFESIFYPAKELFNELIWKKAEFDLHMQLHGIAQKFVMVPSCNYKDMDARLECNDGHLTNGAQCPACKGTGQMPYHTSGQDIIALSLPKKQGDQLLDLSKLIYYHPIPIDVIKMGREEIEKTEARIPLAIFNASTFNQNKMAVAKTATEIVDDSIGRNNVMYEFGLNDSVMYIQLVTQIAKYLDIWRPDMVIEYAYPSDFNLESVDTLLGQLKSANDTNSPGLVKRKINSKIIAKLCIDNAMALKEYETREYWKPFPDISSALLVPELDPGRILFLYFDQIFRELDQTMYKPDVAATDPATKQPEEISFYMLPKDKQKAEIDRLVGVYTEQYKNSKSTTTAISPVINVPRRA